MKRPSFQFYVGDWQSNSNLRRCTFAEKGVWLDVMCLMHDGEEYGFLRWPLKEIAQAVGCKLVDLKSLVAKGVLKGADAGEQCEAYVYTPRTGGKDGTPVTLIPEQPGPLWYSSRMVNDDHVRKSRGKGTRFGEDDPAKSVMDEPTPTRRIGTRQGNEPSHRVGDSDKSDFHNDCGLNDSTFENVVNTTNHCNNSIHAQPTQREGDGPSIFFLQSSEVSKEERTLDSAQPWEAARNETDFQKIYETGSAAFPNLATAQTSAIHTWIAAGCRPEFDVIPEIQRHAKSGKNVRSWAFFTPGIMDAKATRETPAPKGNPNGNHSFAPPKTKNQRLAEAAERALVERERREQGQTG
jgi:hypothetical protein